MRTLTFLLYHRLRSWFFVLTVLLLVGCTSYYGQLASGQLKLLQARQPMAALISDPQTDPHLRQRLRLLLTARGFASRHLALPDNDSYRLYADIHRPYVVWNVFATPEFSVEALPQCFPIAGCVAYRGYFRQGMARAEAARLSLAGQDTLVAGVDAYSTLGWFADPLLSSMFSRNDEQLVALIFHELTHQRFYLPGDTAFNESYASFVEREGLRQWLVGRGAAPPDSAREQAYRQLVAVVLATRERLRSLYTSDVSTEIMRQHKQAEFIRLRQQYARLRREQWGGHGYFDRWISQPLNNATLLPFGLYDGWFGAFAQLFKQVQGDWASFHQAVEQLAAHPVAERKARLEQLMAQANRNG